MMAVEDVTRDIRRLLRRSGVPMSKFGVRRW
jgi:adenylate kinase